MQNDKITVLVMIVGTILLLSNCEMSSSKNAKGKTDTVIAQEDGVKDYLAEGMNIALRTKALLGKNLMSAIQTKGTDKALEFCNVKAIMLTDSMGVNLNARIRRVSDKIRNPENAANEDELSYIKSAKSAIEENMEAWPELHEYDDSMIGYYPIMTNAMCLQCHGKPTEDINEQTLAVISERYPNDKAINYLPNELRGIWVVEMDK